MVALLLVVPLVGVVIPRDPPGLVQAREFWLRDEAGRVRAIIDAGGINYYDENGTVRALVGLDTRASSDEIGAPRFRATAPRSATCSGRRRNR